MKQSLFPVDIITKCNSCK